jgi:hypothetical protein
MVSVAVPDEHAVVPELSSHMGPLTGLAESSSSSKLTLTNVCSLEHMMHILSKVW